MSAPYAYVDHEKLVRDLKAGDQAAVARAYHDLFSSQLGRLVLTHQLAMAGVGHVRGVAIPPHESRYHDGKADHALSILNMAGFGAMSAAHAVTADILEGKDHERTDAGTAGTGTDAGAEDPGFD